MDKIRRRHDALWAARSYFRDHGFLEVDTPQLVAGPGLEPHIDPIAVDVRVSFDGPAVKRWLITSPELSMKKLVAGGAERIFQLGHVFRDGERTARHRPEFTMLEWYRAKATLDDIVLDHEELFALVADALAVPAPRTPFARAEVSELFEVHAHIDLDQALHDGDLVARVRAIAERAGQPLRAEADFDDAFFHVMGALVEPHIGKDGPVVVSRWPAQMAVLARTCDDDARYAERFEVYAGGLELSNAFDELTDPVEQRARFVDDVHKRVAMGKAALPLDEEFLAVLGNMPRTAGCALGFDRLLMYLLKANAIDDVTV